MTNWAVLAVAAVAATIAGAGMTYLMVRSASSRRAATETDAVSAATAASAATADRIDALQTSVARMEGSVRTQLSGLHDQVTTVQRVFTNEGARGGWGELALQRALADAGMVEGRDYVLNRRADSVGRPDAVVRLPDDRKLVVDAKFPVARFVEALESDDPESRQRTMAEHAKAILAEAKALKGRGYHTLAAGGYVVMYLPNEGLISEAMAAEPRLYDAVLRCDVLLAGPSTLLMLLSSAGRILAEHRAVTEAKQIVDDAEELHTRLATFAGHLATVGSRLGSAVDGYNKAVGSWDRRLLPQTRRLADRTGRIGLDDVDPVSASIRPFDADTGDDLRIVG